MQDVIINLFIELVKEIGKEIGIDYNILFYRIVQRNRHK